MTVKEMEPGRFARYRLFSFSRIIVIAKLR
jgi:hypothetical protein